MKLEVILNLIVVILGILIAIAPWTFAPVCPSGMICLVTRDVETILGAAVVVVGLIGSLQGIGIVPGLEGGIRMNKAQKNMLQIVLVIFGCFGIFTYTVTLPVYHYCDYTGEIIEERLGHEVTFTFRNGSIKYYACINISLIVFNQIVTDGLTDDLERIQVRCAQCGMIMDWDDPMNIWIYQPEYLCPTTGNPTIVVVCEGLCTDHFLDRYGGSIVENPYVWL